MIRLTVPSIDHEDTDAVCEAVSSGFLVQGPRVAAFERVVAAAIGANHAIAVANGTCALQLALAALDVGPGDVCVLPAYSWVATANVIELCGARPVFVDIDEKTFNLDADKLDATLTDLMSNPETASKVKAVLPVHTFGQVADMPAISAICERWKLPIIEDAACALGATFDGRQAGSWSALGCFSFHPRKAVTTGEGGMVVTADAALARKVRALRNHGLDPDSATPDFVMAGYNYRLTEFQAALGIVQMSKFLRIVDCRQQAAARYDDLLAGSALVTPHVSPQATHVYQSYVTLLPADRAGVRQDLIRQAREQGVELQVGTIHMPMTTYYRSRYGCRAGDFPVTDGVAARALTLPLFEQITPAQQKEVVEVVLRLVA